MGSVANVPYGCGRGSTATHRRPLWPPYQRLAVRPGGESVCTASPPRVPHRPRGHALVLACPLHHLSQQGLPPGGPPHYFLTPHPLVPYLQLHGPAMTKYNTRSRTAAARAAHASTASPAPRRRSGRIAAAAQGNDATMAAAFVPSMSAPGAPSTGAAPARRVLRLTTRVGTGSSRNTLAPSEVWVPPVPPLSVQVSASPVLSSIPSGSPAADDEEFVSAVLPTQALLARQPPAIDRGGTGGSTGGAEEGATGEPAGRKRKITPRRCPRGI